MFWRGNMHFITWHISSLSESMVFWFDTWRIWTVIFFWWMYGKLCLCCRLIILVWGTISGICMVYFFLSHMFFKNTQKVYLLIVILFSKDDIILRFFLGKRTKIICAMPRWGVGGSMYYWIVYSMTCRKIETREKVHPSHIHVLMPSIVQ